MKALKIIGFVILGLYLLAGLVLYFTQEKLMLYPKKLPDNHIFRAGEEVNLPVSDDVLLNCLWLKKNNSKGVILYLHGNRGSNRRCLWQAESAFGGNGYDIFMPDYRGFGKTGGNIYSEKQMYDDVQAAYNFLKKNYDEKRIVVAGYSLGTGPSSYLAANNDPQQLILVAPYFSLVDMKNRYLPFYPNALLKYHFRNDLHVQKTKCPITVFHGTNDEVLPHDSSERLKALRPDLVEFFSLPGTSHRRTIFQETVKRQIRKLLK